MNVTWQKKAMDFLLISAVAVVLYFAIEKLFFLLFPVILALIFSQMIRNSFRRLRPLTEAVKKILIVLTLLIFFSLFSLLVILLIERLIHGISFFSQGLSLRIDEISSFVQEKIHFAEAWISRVLKRDLENSVTSRLPALLNELVQKIVSLVPQWIGTLINFVPRFFVSFFIFLVCTYYFSCDWNRLADLAAHLISPDRMKEICQMKKQFFQGLGQYFKAYFLLFLLTFSELFFGFVLLKIPGAIGIAFLVAFVDILPILGCGTVLIPWGLLALLGGNTSLGIGLLILHITMFAVRQVMEPKIVGSSIGLHPVLSLILVIGGLFFFGVIGMIFLPLIATCLIRGFREEKQ